MKFLYTCISVALILLIYSGTSGNLVWLVQTTYDVREKLNSLKDVFAAAIEEDCIFTCPEDMKPETNVNHTPKSNGCGTEGFEKLSEYVPVKEITQCCDAHDICYDTCNSDKDVCDAEFKRCLYNHCNYYKAYSYARQVCKAVAKTFYSATFTLGCKSFLDSQKVACYCPSKSPNYSLRKPETKANHTPKSNGCRIEGFKELSEYVRVKEITQCCDAHDICYDTCNSNKDVCDAEFERCLYNHCTYYTEYSHAQQYCKGRAKIFYYSRLLLGRISFLDSQKVACYCPSKSPNIKYKKYSLLVIFSIVGLQ